jgi:rod shape-determining protein MreC
VDGEQPRSPAFITLLLLAALTIITLDARRSHGHSPVDELRSAVGTVLGPTEDATATVFRPVVAIPQHFRSVDALRRENVRLESQNKQLRWQLRAAEPDAARAEDLRRIGSFADSKGYRVVSAQVIGLGPAQSFVRTVTIDVGRGNGVRNDQTVIDADGLVGRVIAITPTTATVLLIVDGNSTVGGRLGPSRELGFVKGNGRLTGDARLTFSLVDTTVSMRRGDTIFSWGSRGGAPYLPGIPIGQVADVRQAAGDIGETGLIRAFADFSSLDMVGVVTAGPGVRVGVSP